MPDETPTKDSSHLNPNSGKVKPGGNTQETSQAEGGENPGETERKVGRTPGQAEGTEDPEDQNEK
jgi:hypothetical protein